ncbi:MAG: hypothetical protein KAW03_09570 [Candidatus Lokiarchaeota archaeon]|nr:hypothetical protein [Candidatus Lokiarchaeota archaeon]
MTNTDRKYFEEIEKKMILIEKKQCIVCHKIVDPERDEFIECVFCQSISHAKCVTLWLAQYNACPMCLNGYVIPKVILVAH